MQHWNDKFSLKVMFQEKKENLALFPTEQISGLTQMTEGITGVGSHTKCGQTDTQTDSGRDQYVSSGLCRWQNKSNLDYVPGYISILVKMFSNAKEIKWNQVPQTSTKIFCKLCKRWLEEMCEQFGSFHPINFQLAFTGCHTDVTIQSKYTSLTVSPWRLKSVFY